MNRVLLLVEGLTEERFVKDVLQPHLWPFDVSLEPKTVTTKLVVGAASHKGGGDFSKLLADIHRLLGDSNAVAVSTFFDFYGFSKNIPGAAAADYADIDKLELRIAAAVGAPRFRPYLQRHEFEAFLFVDPQTTANAVPNPKSAAAIAQQCHGFACVEDINNDPSTAPSKRLATALGSFSKVRLGPAVTLRIGIAKLRNAAPRFSSWVGWLETLGAPT